MRHRAPIKGITRQVFIDALYVRACHSPKGAPPMKLSRALEMALKGGNLVDGRHLGFHQVVRDE